MSTQEQKNTPPEQEIIQEMQEKEKHNAFTSSLEKDLVTCQHMLADWQDKFARLGADFENYKKRMSKEQAMWMQSARVAILSNLLAIIDNFDRAMEHKQAALSPETKNWIDGIAMIHTAFQEFLKKSGVREVPYNAFDPLYHEAIVQVASDKHISGDIVEVLEKGYMIDDHVLRPAKVSVAK